MDALLDHASDANAFSYFGVFIVIALCECMVPRRQPGDALPLRWFGNVALSILNTLLARALFPILGMGFAVVCEQHGWGLLNNLRWPAWVEFTITILVMDLTLYAQHYFLHRFDFLWRLHRTHHTDHDFDLTTGLRFHPLEMTFTTALLLVTVAALGPPPTAIFIFHLLSTSLGFFQHANLKMPASVDTALRMLLVTPDMHRIHHSVIPTEGRSNFGSTFPWWDRLFRTYIDQPAAGHADMRFGVEGFEERKHLTLPWMLAQPFLREDSDSGLLMSAALISARRKKEEKCV